MATAPPSGSSNPPKVRAVFSPQDGGRWMEFTWKDTDANFLPDPGAFAAPGPVEVTAAGDSLEFTAPGWKRTVTPIRQRR